MDEFLTDDERAAEAKTWLRENGPFMVVALAVALGSLIGWNKWQDYTKTRAEQASAVYEELMAAIASERAITAEEKLNQLVDEFGATPYKDQAQLAMARLQMDRNAFDEAAAYLQAVVDSGHTAEIRNIARLRLARVRIHQQQYAEALELLDSPEDTALAARFHEVRGDALLAMERYEEARGEYQLALTSDGSSGVVDRVYVQAKLDDITPVDSGDTEAMTDEPGQAIPAQEDNG